MNNRDTGNIDSLFVKMFIGVPIAIIILTAFLVFAQTPSPTVDKIGGESDLGAWMIGSFALDPNNILATVRDSKDVDVLGLQIGDVVASLEPPTNLDTGLGYCGNGIVANNRLRIYLCNITSSAVNDSSKTWKYRIWNRTVDETE